MLTDAEVDAIAKRAEAATPGPWRCRGIGIVEVDSPGHPEIADCSGRLVRSIHDDVTTTTNTARMHADAALVANSRTDVPALCSTVRELKEQLANVRSVVVSLRAEVKALESEVVRLEGCADKANAMAIGLISGRGR